MGQLEFEEQIAGSIISKNENYYDELKILLEEQRDLNDNANFETEKKITYTLEEFQKKEAEGEFVDMEQPYNERQHEKTDFAGPFGSFVKGGIKLFPASKFYLVFNKDNKKESSLIGYVLIHETTLRYLDLYSFESIDVKNILTSNYYEIVLSIVISKRHNEEKYGTCLLAEFLQQKCLGFITDNDSDIPTLLIIDKNNILIKKIVPNFEKKGLIEKIGHYKTKGEEGWGFEVWKYKK
jgi:hypothetical protein